MTATVSASARQTMLRRLLIRAYRIPRHPGGAAPADAGLDAEDIAIPAVDGRTLRGWFAPAPRTPDARPAVVALHGWGSSAADLLPIAAPLRDLGAHLLFLDARGHGRSDPVDFMSMPRFAEDVESAVAWLAARPDVDTARIALLGHSVGAGACLLAASRDHRIAAVVSVASMAHPAEVMRRMLRRRGLPAFVARPLLQTVERTIGHRFDDFAPIRTVGKVQVPVLIMHGNRDARVPVADAHRLAAAGPSAELLAVPGAGHDSLEPFMGAAPLLRAFFERALVTGRILPPG